MGINKGDSNTYNEKLFKQAAMGINCKNIQKKTDKNWFTNRTLDECNKQSRYIVDANKEML